MKDTRTDQELNRIIAEWMGWKFQPETPLGSPLDYEPEHWLDENGAPVNWFFCEDLNAIHEALKKLTTDPQQERYQCGLVNIMLGKSFGDYLHWTDVGMVFVANAEARQKAEALVAFIESEKGEE